MSVFHIIFSEDIPYSPTLNRSLIASWAKLDSLAPVQTPTSRAPPMKVESTYLS